MSAFQWTPERIDELLTMFRQGYTSYQMAAHFGVSRGSVMGKLHRVRIAMGEKPKRQSDLTRTERRRRAKMLTTLASRADSVSAYVQPNPFVPDEGHLASIVDVTGCRWPVKDDPAFVGGVAFCNHAQKDGSSYCAHHAHINKAPYSDELLRRTYKQINFILKRAA